MFIVYGKSKRYTEEIDTLQSYIGALKYTGGLDDYEVRDTLNRLIAHALQLRVNIEHEKICRGEIEEE